MTSMHAFDSSAPLVGDSATTCPTSVVPIGSRGVTMPPGTGNANT